MRSSPVSFLVLAFLGGCLGGPSGDDSVASHSLATGTGGCDWFDCPPPPPPPPPDVDCWVTGGGHNGSTDGQGAGVSKEDSFGGNAMTMKDGSVRGEWENVNHLGDVFHGLVTALSCFDDGGAGPEVPKADANIAEFSGTGSWNHLDGYTFFVRIEDRAEGGKDSDFYSITIWSPGGTVVYSEADTIAGGNLQIHPPNGGHP
ncbi:MAG: hypothetical protein HYY06_14060 [Deltaproteobacteria bacterium]|nr:hypothetical protein [Deltaproteobacteria bacterium]